MQAEQPHLTGQPEALADVLTLGEAASQPPLRIALLGYRSPSAGGLGVNLAWPQWNLEARLPAIMSR